MSPSARPAVLFLTHHLPWPPHSGGRLREAQLLQRLSARFDIEVVAVSKVPELDRRHVEEAHRHGVRARVFAAQAGGDHSAGPLTRRHTAPAVRAYLTYRLRRSSTIVHVEGHYLLRLLPERVRPAALLVEHNIESVLFEQRAAQCAASAAERATLLWESTRTRTDELRAWRQVRIVGTVTEEDARAIRTAVPDADVRCLPNGADHLGGQSSAFDAAQRAAARLLFVADLRYEPNLHAARLLLEDIYPRILQRCPTTLAIVGSDPPEWLVNAARHKTGVTVTGWVPDVTPWLDAAQVVVCPLTVGGGVKVKVLEALARGCAIVATPIALQGLRHLLPDAAVERSDAHAVANACARLLTCPPERSQQRARAARAARHLPSWDLAAETLASTWTELAATTATAQT